MSTYHCLFPVLDRNQNQNFFFVLSKKWSLMKKFLVSTTTQWYQYFCSLQLNKICEFSFYLFLIYIMVSQTELIRWRIQMPRFLTVQMVSKLALGDIVVMFVLVGGGGVWWSKSSVYINSTYISLLCSICVYIYVGVFNSCFVLCNIYN